MISSSSAAANPLRYQGWNLKIALSTNWTTPNKSLPMPQSISFFFVLATDSNYCVRQLVFCVQQNGQ